MIKNKYVIYLYTMNTNTNMNYINMIQTTLSNLYNYMYSVANDDMVYFYRWMIF
jgi:hypothetical protein